MESKTTIILKVMTIVLMLSCAVAIIATIIINNILGYDLKIASWHYGVGIVFLITLPIHIFLMRKWLIKLFKQFYSLIVDKEYHHACGSQVLPNALKKKSLQEICDFFEVDKATIISILIQKKIYKCSLESTMERLAIENHNDISNIFTIVLERPKWNPLSIQNVFGGRA